MGAAAAVYRIDFAVAPHALHVDHALIDSHFGYSILGPGISIFQSFAKFPAILRLLQCGHKLPLKRRKDEMKTPTRYHRTLAACRPLALFTIMTLAPTLVRAQQLSQMFGNGAGAISQVAAVQVAQDQFVTAVINSTGNLEVIAWYANLNTKQLVRQGTWVDGPVATGLPPQYPAIAISSPFALHAGSSGVFTTAAINWSSNALDIIYWKLQPNGTISKIDETSQHGATAVSIASVYYTQNGYPQFVTAIRNFSGDLEVSLWYVDPTYGIELSGNTAYAGAINAVSIACLQDSNSDVITAVSNSASNLELIKWFYSGSTVTRGNTTYTSTYAINNVAVAPGIPTFNDPPYPVNAFYTASPDNLTIVSPWNQYLGLQGSVTTGSAMWLALAAHNTAAIMVSTPQNPILYDSGGPYSLGVFDQNNSNQFSQVAGALGPYATTVGIAWVDTSSPNNNIFAVAYRNSYGNLQIRLWNYLPACSPNCGG